jgi:hypothetical protein
VAAGALPTANGYTRAFAFLAASAALATLAALLIPTQRRRLVPGMAHRIDHPSLAIVAGGTLTEGDVP